MTPTSRSRLLAAAIALAALAVLGLLALPRVLTAVATRAIRSRAAAREWDTAWREMRVTLPATLRLSGFALRERDGGRMVASAESLVVAIAPLSLLGGRPAPSALFLAHATLAPSRKADADTLVSEPDLEEEARRERGPAAPRVRRAAETLMRVLLLPARSLPRIVLRDVTLREAGDPAGEESDAALRLDALDLAREGGATAFAARGASLREHEVRFDLHARWADDDRLAGHGSAIFITPQGRPETLRVALDGAVHQDRRSGIVSLGPGSRVSLGSVPFALEGRVTRRGPAVTLGLAADGLTDEALRESVPRSLLGPLEQVRVRGSFDYRLSFHVDLEQLDSTDFHADVIPHGLALDGAEREQAGGAPAGTRLGLLSLDEPFVATIHLPKGRFAMRDLSPSNPHFLPLGAMDSILVHAVVTNEDGGFFRHHGFNTEAVRLAIAHNLRAGAFRRGAGTITMQLARNLWLGHDRTLARKAQEVVLAWILEHLAWVSKRRLLEIYLNIIEWGPGIHGADEAAEYYFNRTAQRLTVAQSLFLTTVIPAPSKWHWRFGEDGRLTPNTRAQMHFIGRAMIARGWLSADELPPVDALDVEITGLARDVLFPPEEPKPRGWLRSLFP